jgi:hypothetical protein
MADASVGEPLVLRHAVALWSAETAWGDGTQPATTVGNFMAGNVKHSNNSYYRGPGSDTFVAAKGGGTHCEWTLESDAMQSAGRALVVKAAKTAGVLPSFCLGLGYQDDVGTPNRSADEIPGCMIGRASFRLDASGPQAPLGVTLSGLGLVPATATDLQPATSTTKPYYNYEAVMTRAGSAYRIRAINIDLDNQLRPDYDVPGSTPASTPREPFHFSSTGITITGTVTRYATPGVSVQGNTISQFAMVLAFTSLTGDTALVLTFANVTYDEERYTQREDGQFWEMPFTAQTLAFS